MRKIFSTMMLVAAAAMAFVSCQKETAPSQVEEGYISFTSANPDTKTEWNGETIVWSVGDAIRVACQNDGVWYTSGSTPKAKLYASEALSGGAESVQFKVKTGNSAFPANLTGSLQFYALYPSAAADASFEQDTSCESVKIEAEQKTSSSTYDSSCDIMWGKATTTYASIPTSDPVSIVWNRVVAHANISLNKIPGLVEGEKINTITLTAQEDAALVGTFDLNMATGEFTAKNTSNTITLTSDIIADASGNISFWACINPCTLTELDITVDTDKAVYTTKKTGFSREFKANQRNLLPINMSGATREEKNLTGASLPFQQMFDSIDITNTTALSALEGFVELEKVYPNTGAVRIGNTSSAGTLTTNLLNLSSDFYVRVMAKGYDADEVTLNVTAGGTTQSVDLITFGADAGFVEYVLNFDAIDGSEEVIFTTPSKVRVILDEIEICEGFAVPQPTIFAQTPEKVAANGGTGEIAYAVYNTISGINLTASSNQSWLTIGSTADGKVAFTVAANDVTEERTAIVTLTYGTVTATVTVTQDMKVEDSGEEVTEFYESFDGNTSKGGNDDKWSGSLGSETTVSTDNDGWTFSKQFSAFGCLRFGDSSTKAGSATTPALGMAGSLTLTFSAGAWNTSTEKTTLNLSISGGGSISETQVTMEKSKFTVFTVSITNATSDTKVTFEGINRFFLDEVRVVKN